MRTILLAPVCAVLLVMAASCTPLRWEKPGATAGQTSAAEADCEEESKSKSWQDQWTDDWPPPWYDPTYMPPYYGVGPVPFWRDYPQTFELEEDMTRFCMHSKGYRLISVRS